MSTSVGLPAPAGGQLDVTFEVPDDLLSFGVELDDTDAAAAHAAFVDARLADGAPTELRGQALAQLETARRDLIDGDARYSGVASAELDGRWVMCLFAVSVVAFGPPPEEFHPGNLLAGVLGHRYAQDEALVEEFDTPHGPAVGVRRCEPLTIPGAQPPRRTDTGAAQALVVFPHPAVVGVVSGYCLDLHDLDLTAALVGAIAHTLNITGPDPERPC